MAGTRPLAEWRHALVLAALLGEILTVEIAPVGLWHHLTDAAVILALAYGIGAIRRSWKVGLALLGIGAFAWTCDLVGVVWPGVDVEAIAWASLHSIVAVALLKRTARQTSIRQAEIADAVSAYVAIGIAFAEFYACVLSVTPDALVFVREAEVGPPSYGLVLYYSFVTQLTVGYGDLYPVSAPLRFLTVLQSLIGVLYIAILIARLVSLESIRAYRRSAEE